MAKVSNRKLAQQARRSREARYNRYIDNVKDELDEWDNLSPAQAETALVEIKEYVELQLDSVPGRELRAARRARRYMR